VHRQLHRLPYHLLLAFALVFTLGACDSNDPADDPIDNPGDGDDDGNGDDGDNTYACTVPSLGDVAVGQFTVTFDYAVFNSDDDATGEYTGTAAYGSVDDFGDLYSVVYLPDGDGSARNVTLYDETDEALTPGEYQVDFSGAEGFVGYFLTAEGGTTTRNGGSGTLDIASVEDGVATGTFEFGDSISAFCGAFKAELDENLDPSGFDPN
jgi:hypothetical protein